ETRGTFRWEVARQARARSSQRNGATVGTLRRGPKSRSYPIARRPLMQFERTLLIAAAAAGVALSIPASAETLATAMMPLSIRSGPGPQYSVIGAIPGRGQAMIIGCIQGSMWCQVSYNGRQGWAYAQ